MEAADDTHNGIQGDATEDKTAAPDATVLALGPHGSDDKGDAGTPLTGSAETDEAAVEESPEAPDAYVLEAGHILADLISLRNQTAKQNSKPRPS